MPPKTARHAKKTATTDGLNESWSWYMMSTHPSSVMHWKMVIIARGMLSKFVSPKLSPSTCTSYVCICPAESTRGSDVTCPSSANGAPSPSRPPRKRRVAAHVDAAPHHDACPPSAAAGESQQWYAPSRARPRARRRACTAAAARPRSRARRTRAASSTPRARPTGSRSCARAARTTRRAGASRSCRPRRRARTRTPRR